VKQAVGPDNDARVAHEFIVADGGLQKGGVVVQGRPLEAVGAGGQVQAVLTVAFEIGEQEDVVRFSVTSAIGGGR